MNRSGFYTIAGRLLLGTVMTAGIGLVAIGASTESPSSKPDSSGGGGLFGGSQGQNGALDLSAYDIEVVIKNNKFDELNASGEVQLDKDGMNLSSDKLTYDPVGQKMNAEVTKSPRVKIQSKDATAICGRAIYDMARNIYNLTGDCVITQANGRVIRGEVMNIVNDNGKMKAIVGSTQDSTFASALDPNGKRTVTSQKQEDAIKNIQQTLGISESEARAQFAGKNTPAQIEIDQNAKSPGATGASQSSTTGIIKGDTWDRVPGGPSKGLEVEN